MRGLQNISASLSGYDKPDLVSTLIYYSIYPTIYSVNLFILTKKGHMQEFWTGRGREQPERALKRSCLSNVKFVEFGTFQREFLCLKSVFCDINVWDFTRKSDLNSNLLNSVNLNS